jgi:hypothetical protein
MWRIEWRAGGGGGGGAGCKWVPRLNLLFDGESRDAFAARLRAARRRQAEVRGGRLVPERGSEEGCEGRLTLPMQAT